MSALDEVSALLERNGIAYAVIGAAALAVHGVPRATADLDLLTLDEACLERALWRKLAAAGIGVEIRRGDAADPLAGVLRITAPGESPVDLIVGRHGWQRELLRRAAPTPLGKRPVPVVRAADLVLLKLYAGGPQDAWDIDQLLDVEPGIQAEVEAAVPALPDDCAQLWRRILAARRAPG